MNKDLHRALGSAAILNPGEEQNDMRPSTLLRTCASVTDLDVASVHSASRSSITAACFALKGGLGMHDCTLFYTVHDSPLS